MEFQAFYPERVFPDLYQDVMLFRIFPDSKTFADASPLIQSEEINSLYQKINRMDRQQVLEFVNHWFQLPRENTVIPPMKSKPVDQHISSLWAHLKRPPDEMDLVSSLIALPYSYVVPGGRFREIYYWDSYFTMLGLRHSGEKVVIREMIKNFAWELEQIGHIPNGNRSYFLSRSQPPFFSLMVELLADMEGLEVYNEFLHHLLLEYSFWMDGEDKGENTYRRIVKVGEQQFLNRYYDDSDTPRAESWAEDVSLVADGIPEPKRFYRHLKAACESGWDFSSRWLGESNDLRSIHTTDILPVDLNALLYLLEKTIARSYELKGDNIKSRDYSNKANVRAELMNQLLWDEERGIYSDLIFQENTFGTPSLAMMFPLFAGIANPHQAERSIQFLKDHFLRPGGWVTSKEYTGQQWDAPNGWAPLQWITYIGLKNYGADDHAHSGAENWLQLNKKVFERTGRMMEKYNVEDLSLDAGGGEYPVQDGFGWTNGVYLALMKDLNTPGAE